MPVISMFYGIIVRMFFMDNKEHKKAHIHVEYAEYTAVLSIPEGTLLAGDFPGDKMKLVQAWLLIHQDELMADWKLAIEGQPVFKIEALR
jgi:xanthine dehydrogenase molybdopterin-binding subunit B